MKISSKSLRFLALAATIGLASCGGGSSDSSSNDNPASNETSEKEKDKKKKKKEKKGGEILPQFRGNWVAAKQVLGETDPKPKGCQKSDTGFNYTAKLTMEKSAGVFETMDFLGTTDCSGTNTIAGKNIYKYEVVSTTEDVQILRSQDYSYAYTITGELTVKMMNEARVCGHADWKPGTYKSTDEKMQTCTEGNTSEFLPPYQKPDAVKDILARFRTAGKGMVIDQRDTKVENSEFALPMFLARP